MSLPTQILVATDFSDTAKAAFDYAVELAKKLGARLHIVSALELPVAIGPEAFALPGNVIDEMLRGNDKALADLATTARASVEVGEVLSQVGYPRDKIIDAAIEVHADLIIMGTHGRRGIKRALLGSVAESVAREAPCPVLLVRGGKRA